MNFKKSFRISKNGLLSLCVAAAATGSPLAFAQDDEQIAEEVVVTGYRGSLQNSTEAKRNSIGVVDEIFADDIGKLPSQNLAESLSRIPGVRINREVTGEGQQISVRGLGSNFTKMVLNGNSMAIASMGDMNANANGRQVDLDMLPTELFRSLSVNKTATASQIEGGVSGYINMRTARASDYGEGHQFRFNLDAKYKDTTEETSPKAALGYSFSNDTFGILASVVTQANKTGIDGYETIGNVGQNVCLRAVDSNACRSGETAPALRYYDVATPDFVAANPGYSVGDTIDVDAVANMSSGTVDDVLLPYIGRLATTNGERSSTSALLSFEYLASEDIQLALDILHADSDNDYVRDEFMHFYRRNYVFAPIFSDIVIDDANRIQSGTFYGAAPWVGSQDYQEELSFTSIMPSVDWQITDILRMEASASSTSSDFVRDNPYGLVFTAPGTMTYRNDDVIPTVNHSALDNYDDYSTYDGEDRFRYAYVERDTETQGVHMDFYLGEEPNVNGFKFGIASDEIETTRDAYDPVFDPSLDTDDNGNVSMNEYLAANGLPEMQANMANYIREVDFGRRLDNWSGLDSWGAIDWDAAKDAINYDSIARESTRFTNISEQVTAIYVEANNESQVAGRTLRTNVGIRLVETDQHVQDETGETKVDYRRTLPSFSTVYDVATDVKLRASASRSLTRANPADMFPGAAWNGSGIDEVRVGNPNLAPFESTNFDFGGEWYFGDLGGYVGLTYYTKDITGFTLQDTTQENLDNLGDWGVDLSTLTPTQLEAEEICTPNCTVSVVTRLNTRGVSTLTGVEAIWVQPLDFLVDGLGFNASANNINDKSPEGAEITGVSDSHNLTLYYENDSFQSRVTYYHQDGALSFNSWGMDVTSKDHTQVDLSLSYKLPIMQDYNLAITFDAYNLTNEPVASIIDNDSRQTFMAYYPGATYTFGISGSF